jgi:hypothetical protein
MKLTRKQLNLLIENYLISEGRRDRDYIELLSVSDEDKKLYLDAELKGLKIQDISWIQKNRDTFDLFHVIQSVLEYKKDKFKEKVKSKAQRSGSKDLLKRLNLSSFDSIQDLDRFISEINVDLSSFDRSSFAPLESGNDLEIVGKVGPWTIILPKTIRGSISCDPRIDRDTTWCTTKRSGQNLFYSYVGDDYNDVMLFYVMDYNRKPDNPSKAQKVACVENNDSRMSIGVVDSELDLSGKDGGLSVDASNKGIKLKDLKRSLGKYYDEVVNIINMTIQKYDGVSPAKEILRKSAQSLEVLISVIKDYDKSSKFSFIDQILRQQQRNVSQEVLEYLSNDNDKRVRQVVASHGIFTTPQILDKLSNDVEPEVRKEVASNRQTNLQTLEKLTNDDNKTVRIRALSWFTARVSNPQILDKLSNNNSIYVRAAVARNRATSPETLDKLSNDKSEKIRRVVAGNTSTSPETLDKLSNHISRDVRVQVAANESTPTQILEKLLNDEDQQIRKIAKRVLSGLPAF